MSKRNRDRRYKAPPASRIPENVEGPRGEIEEIHIGSWCPLPDGRGPATQVHMTIRIRGLDIPLVLRFKGPVTLDRLIDSLERHRYDVWPGEAPIDPGAAPG